MRRTVIAAALAAAALVRPAGAQTVAITNATIHPVSGPRIENGTIVIRDGRIVAVGANVSVPADAQRIDGTGKIVTPGFVNANTSLGVVDIGAVQYTNDVRARGGEDNVAAAFSVVDGLNPANVFIAPTRADGVTSAIVMPQGGLIAGQAAYVDLGGATSTDMIRRAPAGMVANLSNSQAAGVGARGELLSKLRELLVDARTYRQRRSNYEAGDSRELSASRADLEAMLPVLDGRVPLVAAADRASDIEAALRLGREFGLRLIIAGGAEAWQVAEALRAARVPVLTGAMNNIPASFTELGQRQENAALLARAGVPIAFVGNGSGDEELFNVRNIRYEAGNAVAYGMPWDAALRALTLAPAEIFGVADRVGSLAAGKDANLVVWSGDPFEFATRAEHVFVKGRDYTEPTRQDLLARRYRQLPPAYGPKP